MIVSIVTPAYNSESTIADTMESIANQTYENIEQVVVDGKSSDRTLQIVTSHFNNVQILSESDKGIYDAMNKGVQMATGEIVGILNSDDFYANSQVIEEVMRVFEDESVDAVYGDLVYVDERDTSKVVRIWKSGEYKLSEWKKGWMPPHPTFFVRKECYEKFGSYSLELKSSADYELMLRMCYKHKIRVAYLPKILVHMRTGGQSNASIGNRIKANREDREAWRMNDLKPAPFTTILKPLRKITQFLR